MKMEDQVTIRLRKSALLNAKTLCRQYYFRTWRDSIPVLLLILSEKITPQGYSLKDECYWIIFQQGAGSFELCRKKQGFWIAGPLEICASGATLPRVFPVVCQRWINEGWLLDKFWMNVVLLDVRGWLNEDWMVQRMMSVFVMDSRCFLFLF